VPWLISAARWEWVFDDRGKGLVAGDLAGLIYQWRRSPASNRT
jgi:hypothetical protein